MSKASEDSVNINKIQIVIGIVTIFGLALTVYYARKAANAAEEAAMHGRTAAVATVDAARASQISADAAVEASTATVRLAESERPWIVFERFEAGPAANFHLDEVFHKNGIAVRFFFTNVGRAPAIDTCGNFRQCTYDKGGQPPYFMEVNIPEMHAQIIGPGKGFESPFIMFIGNDWERILRRELNILIYFYITYMSPNSISSKVHTTETCVSIEYRGGEGEGSDGRPIPQFSGSQIGKQNRIT